MKFGVKLVDQPPKSHIKTFKYFPETYWHSYKMITGVWRQWSKQWYAVSVIYGDFLPSTHNCTVHVVDILAGITILFIPLQCNEYMLSKLIWEWYQSELSDTENSSEKLHCVAFWDQRVHICHGATLKRKQLIFCSLSAILFLFSLCLSVFARVSHPSTFRLHVYWSLPLLFPLPLLCLLHALSPQ